MRRGMFLTPIFIVGVMVLSEGFADEPFGHLKYMLAHVGEDGVGLGSDFDGAKMASGLGSAAALQTLVDAMRARGFDQPLIEKVCFKNWLRLLGQTWGETG
jgi:membrane dipeptidase